MKFLYGNLYKKYYPIKNKSILKELHIVKLGASAEVEDIVTIEELEKHLES